MKDFPNEIMYESGWNDPEGSEIYGAAIHAIIHARQDGSGKHSPESWKEETIQNQIIHADEHLGFLNLCLCTKDEDYTQYFNVEEAEHALCRLAIAIALYKRSNNDSIG